MTENIQTSLAKVLSSSAPARRVEAEGARCCRARRDAANHASRHRQDQQGDGADADALAHFDQMFVWRVHPETRFPHQPRLAEAQRREMAKWVEDGPNRKTDGVVRWRWADL
jgi:hypothetical protein